MTVDLKLYVDRNDYDACSGQDWPTYDEYVQGKKADIPKIQANIDNWEPYAVSRFENETVAVLELIPVK